MKFFLVAAAIAIVGASAQSTTISTVLAPCGTDCPTAVPDKSITRSKEPATETTPCPSVIVSSVPGGSNGTGPGAPGSPSSPPPFTGGAGQIGMSVGALAAAAGALLAL